MTPGPLEEGGRIPGPQQGALSEAQSWRGIWGGFPELLATLRGFPCEGVGGGVAGSCPQGSHPGPFKG